MNYLCRCRVCKREYRSDNELDTDGYGCCEEHRKEQERRAQAINEKIAQNGHRRSPLSSLDAEDVKRHYMREVERKPKTFL